MRTVVQALDTALYGKFWNNKIQNFVGKEKKDAEN
jgi:hypothetical protein